MILDNTLYHYLYAILAFFIAISLSLFFKYIVINRLKSLAERTKNTFDDFILSLLVSMKLPFYIVISLYIATQFLVLHATIRKMLDTVFVVCIVYQLITLILIFLDYSLDKKVKEANGSSIAHIKDMIQLLIKVGLWTVGLLFILSNLGINITSLVAGLGIGGIAVALAVQNILGDLFSYFAIYFDRPFVKGDFIIIGKEAGVIEKVGIKTTRIRALQGEEIVISNSELTSSRIQNFKRMEERRVVFTFNVSYETPLEKLEKIPQHIQDIIAAIELVRFDRAHLLAFGDSAYVFEVVYYVQSPDHKQYMDVHQSIHFSIITVFAQEKIEIACPTHKLHVAQSDETYRHTINDTIRHSSRR
jgi:small-conductance mechanosensitive channel